MFKLTIEFKSNEELTDFVVNNLGNKVRKISEVAEVKQVKEEPVAELPPVIEKKAPAKKAAKQKPVEVEAEELEEVESPFVAATKPPFDREGAIVTAQKLVGQLKATGIADDKVMPAIHQVYHEAGCPINLKISQLEDDLLEKFIPLFEAKVNQIVSEKSAAKTAPASFI